MTRSEALLKLLALEPETRARLIVITGWNADDTESTLDSLVKNGKVTYRNGTQGTHGERLYYAKPVPQGDAGALPVAAGASRKRVRHNGSGLVRGTGQGLAGWPGTATENRSGEEAQ